MTQNIDFKQLKQKTYLAYHQDGLIDLLVGLGIIGFGINMASESSAFIVLSWIPFILYAPLKKKITIPRLGYVKFDSERTKSIQMSKIILLGVLTFAMFLGLFIFTSKDTLSPEISDLLGKYHMLILGTITAAAFVVTAVTTGIKRFYGQAILAELVLIIGIELGIEPPTYVLIWGALTFLIGAILLIRFLQQHPHISEKNDVVS